MGPLKAKATVEREAYKCYICHDYRDRNHNIANHILLASLEGKKHGGSVSIPISSSFNNHLKSIMETYFSLKVYVHLKKFVV